MEASKPPGIMAFVDEECVFPTGSDESLLKKLVSNLGKNAHFEIPPKSTNIFTVKHYAGKVNYSVKNFLDKNRDALYYDLVEMICSSRQSYIAGTYAGVAKPVKGKRPPTAGSQFKNQVVDLINTLKACTPHYVRCIKPNDTKTSGNFEDEMVRAQIKYLGLLENVRVRRAGFAYRSEFKRFALRYKMVSGHTWPKYSCSDKEACQQILKDLDIIGEGEIFQFGESKLFIRHPRTLFALEAFRDRKMHDVVSIIQGAYRAFKARKYYMELKKKAMGIFAGKKRRRNSVNVFFLGDYIHAKDNLAIEKVMQKNGENRILFADKVIKINKKMVFQQRILLITEAAIYNLTEKFVVRRRIALKDVKSCTLSTFADSFIAFNVPTEYDYLFMCDRKSEIVTLLSEEASAFNIGSTFTDKFDVLIDVSSSIFTGKKSTTLHVNFVEDASLDFKTKAVDWETDAKTMTLTVKLSKELGSGAPIQLDSSFDLKVKGVDAISGDGSVMRGHKRPLSIKRGDKGLRETVQNEIPSAAAAPADVKKPNKRDSKPLMPTLPGARPSAPLNVKRLVTAKFKYESENSDDLTFEAGQVITVLEKSGEWWVGEIEGRRGFFPGNYVL